jgi:hypothetical protein
MWSGNGKGRRDRYAPHNVLGICPVQTVDICSDGDSPLTEPSTSKGIGYVLWQAASLVVTRDHHR